MLAKQLVDAVRNTQPNQLRTRIAEPTGPGDPYYLFQMFPWDADVEARRNRERRMSFLRESCGVLKLVFPDALDVIGIATEAGNDKLHRSEDAVYYDARQWSTEDETAAKEFQSRSGVLTKHKRAFISEKEYPDLDPPPKRSKSGRNEPCPCGSGMKFKRCHGLPEQLR
jgi:hypothetical protein